MNPFRLTSFSDIAGQMTAKFEQADKITAAGVALPTGALRHCRDKLPKNLPKWRDASDSDTFWLIPFLKREALAVSTGTVDKTSDDWARFWEDGRHAHKGASSEQGSSSTILKPATLAKIQLFGQCATSLVAHAINCGSIPRRMQRTGKLHLYGSVVIDKDIDGRGNQEALADTWRAVNEHQPLTNAMGLYRKVGTLQLTTEQLEPLLLIPDYVAGIAQAARSTANTLAKSRVSVERVQAVYEDLLALGTFHDFSHHMCFDYFSIFPDFARFSRRHAA
jgi:hypothetical protein